jgi:hypothetical protein
MAHPRQTQEQIFKETDFPVFKYLFLEHKDLQIQVIGHSSSKIHIIVNKLSTLFSYKVGS